MSSEQNHPASLELPVFGSPRRVGRDEPAYQEDRLRRLASFALRLAGAHERQMQHVWRELYRLGRSWDDQHDFIHQQQVNLDKANADVARLAHGWDEQQALLGSQREYIVNLEQERDRLWAEVQRIGAGWEEQKRLIDAQAARLQELERQSE